MVFGLFEKKEERFDLNKIRPNLKMSLTRIGMVQTKHVNLVKRQRRELAELMNQRKFEACRVKVESLIREDLSIEGMEVLKLFIDLTVSRLAVISESKTCPSDLKEAVTSVIWAAPRLTEVNELIVVRNQFVLKYGKEFVEMAQRNGELSVNDKLLAKLGMQVPTGEHCTEYLQGIATEFGLEFDPDDWRQAEALVTDVAAGEMDPNAMTSAMGQFLVPPILVPRDELEARLLALKRQ